ncbi:MAG: NADH-quinone oxidoreductase subunit NuoE, partial [Rickettsiales bacterium]|nr:NADH-quinone oxidoreductase subunit NuoE [Rickettsiales bacterium]
KEAKKHIAKYPQGRQASAVIPLLEIAQKQNDNWLPIAAMEHVAEILEMPQIRVMEVATFYTMFNLSPVGKHHIQLCGTTPCWLRGAEDIKNLCKKKLKIDLGDTTKDKLFTLSEVECLGSCANAPMIQINDDFYEDLDVKSMTKILDDLTQGKKVKKGSQIGRKSSEVLHD